MLNLRHISLAAVFVLTTGMTGCNDNTNTTVAKSNAPAEANLPTETVTRAVATIKAYVAADKGGLVIIDISDPAHPTELDSYDTVENTEDVTLSSDGTKAYLADGLNGLVIIDGIK